MSNQHTGTEPRHLAGLVTDARILAAATIPADALAEITRRASALAHPVVGGDVAEYRSTVAIVAAAAYADWQAAPTAATAPPTVAGALSAARRKCQAEAVADKTGAYPAAAAADVTPETERPAPSFVARHDAPGRALAPSRVAGTPMPRPDRLRTFERPDARSAWAAAVAGTTADRRALVAATLAANADADPRWTTGKHTTRPAAKTAAVAAHLGEPKRGRGRAAAVLAAAQAAAAADVLARLDRERAHADALDTAAWTALAERARRVQAYRAAHPLTRRPAAPAAPAVPHWVRAQAARPVARFRSTAVPVPAHLARLHWSAVVGPVEADGSRPVADMVRLPDHTAPVRTAWTRLAVLRPTAWRARVLGARLRRGVPAPALPAGKVTKRRGIRPAAWTAGRGHAVPLGSADNRRTLQEGWSGPYIRQDGCPRSTDGLPLGRGLAARPAHDPADARGTARGMVSTGAEVETHTDRQADAAARAERHEPGCARRPGCGCETAERPAVLNRRAAARAKADASRRGVPTPDPRREPTAAAALAARDASDAARHAATIRAALDSL